MVLRGGRRLGRLITELGFQPVEDDPEAKFETALGSGGIVRGAGIAEASAQPWELRRDLGGLRQVVTHQFFGVIAVLAELAGE